MEKADAKYLNIFNIFRPGLWSSLCTQTMAVDDGLELPNIPTQPRESVSHHKNTIRLNPFASLFQYIRALPPPLLSMASILRRQAEVFIADRMMDYQFPRCAYRYQPASHYE